MSNDVRTDIGSDYSFRIEASDAKRVRVLNLGPDSVYYDVVQEVSVADGTELATGASTNFATPQWVISAGFSRAYLYYYEFDDIIDSFEIRGGAPEDPDEEGFVFRPAGIEEGNSVEFDGTDWVPATYIDEDELAVKQDESVITASGLGVCAHGATAGTARPTGFLQIMWVGSATPSNATDGDLWVDTT